jgi:hypothetical protein
MKNIKITPGMATSLDKKDTLEKYCKNAMIAMKYRESYEAKQLESFLRLLNKIDNELLDNHDEDNCCSSKLYFKHFEFQ